MKQNQKIILLAALDTKGEEAAFLKEIIQSRTHQVTVIDFGILGLSSNADITPDEVAQAGGENIVALRNQSHRGAAVTAMARGTTQLVQGLYSAGKIDGLIGLGGWAGTWIATQAMQSLPLGVPKVMVSTLASGDTSSFVGTSDIVMMHTVVDIAGLNYIMRRILNGAAGAISGMVEQPSSNELPQKPLIGTTMFGVTTPCVTQARQILEEYGFEVLTFHANGVGGQAMEQLAEQGILSGVLDITTTELVDEIAGGIMSAGAHRLEAAGRVGLPQVISVGALDVINLGPLSQVPKRFRSRLLEAPSPTSTFMRSNVEENQQLGYLIAEKVNHALGPVTVVLPLLGTSSVDYPGQSFEDNTARQALFDSLRSHVEPQVRIIEVNAHINDSQFAEVLASTAIEMFATR